MVLIYVGGPHTLGKTTAIKLASEKLGPLFYYIRGAEFLKKKFRKSFSGKKFGEQTNREMQKFIEEAALEIRDLARKYPEKLIVVDGHFVINRIRHDASIFTQLIPECAKYFDGIVLIKGNPLVIQERRQNRLEMRRR
ncbi:MAG: AAA family ATPase [Candidatus ainarchaeum sp.]|nr:AAA family ATPase [Candidatus ainarchaeum sp.]